MKVLQICSFYAINNLYRNLFNELNNIGIESDIYIPCKPKNIPVKVEENEYYSGVYKNGNSIYEKFINIIGQYEFYKKNNNIYENLKKKVSVENYNIIHAHSLFENGYLAYKSKLEFGIDYIVAVRNTDVNGYFKEAKHLRKIGIEIMKNAKRIIFISPSYKEFVIKNFVKDIDKREIVEKSEVIANGIDDFWVENISTKKRHIVKEGEVHLIQPCRIDKNKNISTSIEITKELRKRGFKSFINIVGDGAEKENLIKKYRNLTYVQFNDKASKEELKNYYDNSDILIMPSKYETFGLVYPEAMSRGLPIVYTKNQGFDKYFDDGEVGFPINYSSIEDGAEAIIKILKNYNYMSNKCIENSRLFSWRKIADKYIIIYLE
ncbi:MAG: glycosyltransferase family 4 protein [Clostridium sp.]|uniref:glycosyltransferase family 4 protein n=1 Tax=Clostridium sp. TaxID=1506 RepID=UPI0025B9AF6A|nr:glycosyltransferase family 4 protein [Clostridium sp.]MCF0147278.1 glycosyltransferase family 4 protein [Clostridium sp.]